LTGSNFALKISVVGRLQRRFGCDGTVSNSVEYYRETILFLLH